MTSPTASESPSPEAEELLVERLAEQMRLRWEQGGRPLVEDLFAEHPWLWDRPERALDLIYEEVCLREKYGLPSGRRGFLRRFPAWGRQLEVLFDCHQLLEPLAPPASFPAVGERVGDFVLTAELGKGATGRVYLASQTSLAERPVALKLMPWSGREHLCLARLQHTHIVPLHTAEVDAARRLRVLCMPYFGGAALSRVLERLSDRPAQDRTGRDLVAALDQAGGPASEVLARRRPVCEFLAGLSWTRAVCHVGAC